MQHKKLVVQHSDIILKERYYYSVVVKIYAFYQTDEISNIILLLLRQDSIETQYNWTLVLTLMKRK